MRSVRSHRKSRVQVTVEPAHGGELPALWRGCCWRACGERRFRRLCWPRWPALPAELRAGAEMTTARARARWVGRRPHISGSIIDWGWRRRVNLSRAAIPGQKRRCRCTRPWAEGSRFGGSPIGSPRYKLMQKVEVCACPSGQDPWSVPPHTWASISTKMGSLTQG